MIQKLSTLLLGAIAAFTIAGATAVSAQTIYEVMPTDLSRDATDNGYLARITVAAPTTITAIAQETRSPSGEAVRFFIINNTDNETVYASAPKNFGPDAIGVFSFKQSDSFSPITLQPGKTYAIGLISPDMHYVRYSNTLSASENGITPVGTVLYVNSISPIGVAVEPVQSSLRLVGVSASPASVPTMSEWAMILLGLALAGGAALYIQRCKAA